MSNEKSYGFEVTFEARIRGGGILETEEKKIHRKGTATSAERAAKLTTGFVRLVKVEPFTEAQWLSYFGRGKM